MPTQNQSQLALEEKKTDAALQRAIDHANDAYPMWGPLALGYLIGYAVKAKAEGRHFTCEEVRRHAVNDGIPVPPDTRAWGGVFRSAQKVGYIRSTGMTRNVGRHRGYATFWEGA